MTLLASDLCPAYQRHGLRGIEPSSKVNARRCQFCDAVFSVPGNERLDERPDITPDITPDILAPESFPPESFIS